MAYPQFVSKLSVNVAGDHVGSNVPSLPRAQTAELLWSL